MAVIYKAKFDFRQAQFSWSEAWFSAGAVEADEIATRVNRYLRFRSAMLYTNQSIMGVQLSQYRSTSDDIFGQRVSRYYQPGTQPIEPGSPFNLEIPASGLRTVVPPVGPTSVTPQDVRHPDQVRAALQLEVVWDGGAKSVRYLAGIPDGVSFTEPQTLNIWGDPGWQASFQNWAKEVQDNWAVRVIQPYSLVPEVPILRVVQESAAPSNIGIVVASPAPTLPLNHKILIRGSRTKIRGYPSLNGTWTVASFSDAFATNQTVFYLSGSEAGLAAQYKKPGMMRPKRYGLATIRSIRPTGVGIHKRGGTTRTPRGRRQTRALLDP